MTAAVDYYEVLEISPSAKPDQVRSAYYRLAKRFHPDANGRGVESDPGHERFLAIQKAYEVLGDAVARSAYDEQLESSRRPSGGTAAANADSKASETAARSAPAKRNPSLEEIRRARQAFQRAEELLEAGSYDKAMTLMQAVVRTVDDDPEYSSLYGYVLALNGQRLHVARDACRQAVEAQPYNMDYKARLAYVYQRAGLKNTANEFFAEVLRQDPKNALAREHVTSKDDNGLLGGIKRLFKRD